MKNRIVIEYTPYGSNKIRYSAATLDSYGGDRVFLDTIYGRQVFSRADGRWMDGDCLNFLDGRIHEFDKLDEAIKGGDVFSAFEGNSVSEPTAAPAIA